MHLYYYNSNIYIKAPSFSPSHLFFSLSFLPSFTPYFPFFFLFPHFLLIYLSPVFQAVVPLFFHLLSAITHHPPKHTHTSSILFTVLTNCVKRMSVAIPRSILHWALVSLCCTTNLTHMSNLLTVYLIGWRMCGDGGAEASISLSQSSVLLRLSVSSIAMVMSSSSCEPTSIGQSTLITGKERRERSDDEFDD